MSATRGTIGALAIACLTMMLICSGIAAIFGPVAGSYLAATELILLAGFAVSCLCAWSLLRLARSRPSRKR